MAQAVESEDPKGLGAEGLTPSVDSLGRSDSPPPAQDTVDFLGHPFGFRQNPIFLQLMVDRYQADDTQSVGPEVSGAVGPDPVIPNPAQPVQDQFESSIRGFCLS